MASPGSIHETGHWELCTKDIPEGWDGERGGRAFGTGGHIYTYDRFMSVYGKKHHDIVK